MGEYNTKNTAIVKRTAGRLAVCSRLELTKNFIQHGNVTVYSHCISVAIMSVRLARFFGLNVSYRSLIKGAILHDYFLYDWHDEDEGTHKWHGFTHPRTALKNAEQDFNLNNIEKDIIRHHMFPLVPLPPKTVEGWIVTTADKLCALYEVFSSSGKF